MKDQNSTPLVSIIVPIYKVEIYLKKCLNSLTNQTYRNIEIILIDDGSSDQCPQICDEYSSKDSRIKVIHKENGGVATARNKGLEIASGEYLMFNDPDDFYVLNMVEIMVDAITSQKVDCVRCKAKIYDENENIIEESFYGFENKRLSKDVLLDNIDIFYKTEKNISTWIWALIIKRNLAPSFNESLKMIDDYEWYSRMLHNIDSIFLLDKPLYNYIYNNNSIVNGLNKDNIKTKIDALKQTIEQAKSNFKEYGYLNKVEKLMNLKILYTISFRLSKMSKLSFNDFLELIKYAYNTDHMRTVCQNLPENIGIKDKIKAFLIQHKMFKLIALLTKL